MQALWYVCFFTHHLLSVYSSFDKETNQLVLSFVIQVKCHVCQTVAVLHYPHARVHHPEDTHMPSILAFRKRRIVQWIQIMTLQYPFENLIQFSLNLFFFNLVDDCKKKVKLYLKMESSPSSVIIYFISYCCKQHEECGFKMIVWKERKMTYFTNTEFHRKKERSGTICSCVSI